MMFFVLLAGGGGTAIRGSNQEAVESVITDAVSYLSSSFTKTMLAINKALYANI